MDKVYVLKIETKTWEGYNKEFEIFKDIETATQYLKSIKMEKAINFTDEEYKILDDDEDYFYVVEKNDENHYLEINVYEYELR